MDEVLRRVKNRRTEFVVRLAGNELSCGAGAGLNPAPHRTLNPGLRRG